MNASLLLTVNSTSRVRSTPRIPVLISPLVLPADVQSVASRSFARA